MRPTADSSSHHNNNNMTPGETLNGRTSHCADAGMHRPVRGRRACPGLSDQTGHHRRNLGGGRSGRRDRACRGAAADRGMGAAGCGREQGRRQQSGRNDGGRTVCARWLHAAADPGAHLHRQSLSLSQAVVRSGEGFHPSQRSRQHQSGPGGASLARDADRRRSDRGGQGQARAGSTTAAWVSARGRI